MPRVLRVAGFDVLGVVVYLEVQPATTVMSKAFCRSMRPGSSSTTRRCLNLASVASCGMFGGRTFTPTLDHSSLRAYVNPDSRRFKWLDTCVAIGYPQKMLTATEDSMTGGIAHLSSVGP
jgi:hypothetical protein